MAAKDPYKLLGVSKSATDAEIKKAYRQLAKKLHPDANPGDAASEAKFKEITAAYTLLSDKDMRARYDSGKVDASGQAQGPFGGGARGGGFRHADFGGVAGDEMADLFSSLFGMNMGGFGGPRRGGMRRPQKGADIRYKMSLTFVESLNGGTKRVKMGNGQTLDVKIPRGVEDGKTLRLRGKGQSGLHGGPAGDAKVEIAVKSHKYISREGKNIRVMLPISLQEAVLGAKVRIPMPGGTVSLNVPAGTNTGKTFRLKGKGVSGGDLLATIHIVLDDPKSEELVSWAKESGAPASDGLRETWLK